MTNGDDYIPNPTIEQKALRMLTSYEKRFGKVTRLPVPVDKIAESHLDLIFDWDEIAEKPGEVILAYLSPLERKIRMNTHRRNYFDSFPGVEAFTVAHEVGHWDLHVYHLGGTQLGLPLDFTAPYWCRGKKRDRREVQADRYAAYLLMPHHLLMQEIADEYIYEWQTLYALRERFHVSISALTRRLTDLGLIYIDKDKKIYSSESECAGNLKMF